MDVLYDGNGAAIGMLQRDGNRTNAFSAIGESLGWSDGQDIYSYDGSLVARRPDAIGVLWRERTE